MWESNEGWRFVRRFAHYMLRDFDGLGHGDTVPCGFQNNFYYIALYLPSTKLFIAPGISTVVWVNAN